MNKVRELRLLKKCKQKDVAQSLGICNDYLSLIERDKQTPGFRLANRIAEYFNVSLDDLNFFKNEQING